MCAVCNATNSSQRSQCARRGSSGSKACAHTGLMWSASTLRSQCSRLESSVSKACAHAGWMCSASSQRSQRTRRVCSRSKAWYNSVIFGPFLLISYFFDLYISKFVLKRFIFIQQQILEARFSPPNSTFSPPFSPPTFFNFVVFRTYVTQFKWGQIWIWIRIWIPIWLRMWVSGLIETELRKSGKPQIWKKWMMKMEKKKWSLVAKSGLRKFVVGWKWIVLKRTLRCRGQRNKILAKNGRKLPNIFLKKNW